MLGKTIKVNLRPNKKELITKDSLIMGKNN
jgi:hypothetical protein